MSRSKKFIAGLLSGYVSIAANVAFSLATVPLALTYLDKAEFAVWALVTQIGVYLGLVDLGMSGSLSRQLIDHKDRKENGDYLKYFRTGAFVLRIQALLIALAGCLLGVVLPSLLDIPPSLQPVFRNLVVLQSLLVGLGFWFKIYQSALYAHQRLDVLNLTSVGTFVVQFGVQWLCYVQGWKLYSLTAALAVSWLVSTGLVVGVAVRSGFGPRPGLWCSFDLGIFRKLFSYGFDLFWVAVGWQLVAGSQIFIVSKTMGLEAAAIWSVCLKPLLMAQQVVWKVFDTASAAFAEMIVRGERKKLKERFDQLYQLNAGFAAWVAAGIAACNSAFVALWTENSMVWNPWNDLWLGLLLMTYSISRCHTTLILQTKDIRGLKFILLLEAVVLVGLGSFATPRFGYGGLIASAIFANFSASAWYGFKRSSGFFFEPPLRWLVPLVPKALLFFVVVVLAAGGALRLVGADPVPVRLGVGALAVLGCGGMLFFLLKFYPDRLKLQYKSSTD